MAKIPKSKEDVLLKKNIPGGDEDDEELDDEEEDLDEELDDEEEDDEDEDDSEEDDEEDDDDEDDSKKSKKARAILNAQNRFLKKEGYEFKNGKWVKPERPVEKKSSKSSKDLSTSDVFTLVKANVHEEDIDEVRDYAALKKITIKEALKTNFVKSFLADKQEERDTAEAAHGGSSRRSTGRKSAANVIADAESGNLPEDPTELAKARLSEKRAEGQRRKR